MVGRLDAGHRHGVSLCETMCSLAPLSAPCFPLLPRGPAPSVCPSLVCCLPLIFFWLPSWPRSSLLRRALRVSPALLRATPVSPARAPSLACLPSNPPSLRRSCLQFFNRPHCLCRAVTRVCHPRALPLPLSVVPTLFPGGSPTLVLFPRSLPLPSSGLPWFTVWGVGFTCGLDCGPARGAVRCWPLGFHERDVPHAARSSKQ